MNTYRIYFDAHASAPLVWSVDTGAGTPEQKFSRIVLVRGSWAETIYDPAAPAGSPTGWIELHGVLTVRGTKAFIECGP